MANGLANRPANRPVRGVMVGDPFRHHPELRGRLLPVDQSFFRTLDLKALDARMAEAGLAPGWRTPSKRREAQRRRWLDRFAVEEGAGDLWVFAYGSLMWDPSIEFAEVRQARSDGYRRSFCLWDDGGRGTVEQPGLMLALDEGGACDGLAFRIAAEQLDHETFVLFRREMIAPAYRPEVITLETAQGTIRALAFVADRGLDNIRPGLPLETQAAMIARAEGVLGTNFDYLANTVRHLDLLGLEDGYLSSLWAAARAVREGGRSPGDQVSVP